MNPLGFTRSQSLTLSAGPPQPMLLRPELYLGNQTPGRPFGYVTESLLGLWPNGGGGPPPPVIPTYGVSSNGSSANWYKLASITFPSYPNITMRAWVKRQEDRDTYGGIVTGTNFATEAILMGVGADGTSLYAYSGGVGDYTSGTTLDTNWHHLVLTYDGTTSRIYLDGALIGSGATDNLANPPTEFGLLNEQFGARFHGAVHGVAIWDSVLTLGQIVTDMAHITPAIPAWAWWLLDGVNDVTDRSGNGRHMVKQGTPVAIAGPGVPL